MNKSVRTSKELIKETRIKLCHGDAEQKGENTWKIQKDTQTEQLKLCNIYESFQGASEYK